MDKDAYFALAVQLAAPAMTAPMLGTPSNENQIAQAIKTAYSAIRKAHEELVPD